jgi:signal transduction histidine kinase
MQQTAMSVLVIEDDPGDADLLQAVLADVSGASFDFTWAERLATGLKYMAEMDFDVVLLDLSLPDSQGIETFYKVHAQTPKAPVVVLTGFDDAAVAIRAMQAGAQDFLNKGSMDGNMLTRAMRYAIERYHLQEQLACQTQELVQANDALVRSNQELDQSTHVLTETNQELRHKNVEIQQFYHMISHELKTPLTTAREFVAIILDGLAGPLNDTQREYLSYAKESCDQMTFGLNDLLDAARLETGKLSLTLHCVPIDTVVLRAVASIAPSAHAKGIRLYQDIASDLPAVLIDERRITQVLANLLSNALKFTPPGGEVTVRVSHDPRQSTGVLVTVSDTGRGIEPEQLDYIFDRLYQVRSDDAAIEGGLGLGLHVCREIVKLHGGEIWVESTPGKGSTFHFTVPKQHECNTVTTSINKEIVA